MFHNHLPLVGSSTPSPFLSVSDEKYFRGSVSVSDTEHVALHISASCDFGCGSGLLSAAQHLLSAALSAAVSTQARPYQEEALSS